MKIKEKEKINYGDYQILAEMLTVSSDAARKRYKRGDKEAVEAMNTIQENRKQLLEDYRKNLTID
ncbi:hypothetical protein [Chryseobacterium sp.]|uniref:hypothetical protein n=1 Tax=Chryseobacterium sp. TaxID=1871047 RepID=UPI0028986D38|nr:hypothetical protein [Chryseobacterium sp.]